MFFPPGMLQSSNAAVWCVGPSRHGGACPGGDEESWRASQRHNVWILQQGSVWHSITTLLYAASLLMAQLATTNLSLGVRLNQRMCWPHGRSGTITLLHPYAWELYVYVCEYSHTHSHIIWYLPLKCFDIFLSYYCCCFCLSGLRESAKCLNCNILNSKLYDK